LKGETPLSLTATSSGSTGALLFVLSCLSQEKAEASKREGTLPFSLLLGASISAVTASNDVGLHLLLRSQSSIPTVRLNPEILRALTKVADGILVEMILFGEEDKKVEAATTICKILNSLTVTPYLSRTSIHLLGLNDRNGYDEVKGCVERWEEKINLFGRGRRDSRILKGVGAKILSFCERGWFDSPESAAPAAAAAGEDGEEEARMMVVYSPSPVVTAASSSNGSSTSTSPVTLSPVSTSPLTLEEEEVLGSAASTEASGSGSGSGSGTGASGIERRGLKRRGSHPILLDIAQTVALNATNPSKQGKRKAEGGSSSDGDGEEGAGEEEDEDGTFEFEKPAKRARINRCTW
jgi:hypothetical protein